MAVSKYQQHFRTMARYNKWAYKLVFAKAAELTEEEYRANDGLPCLSVHGTLSHLLLGDMLWYMRMTGLQQLGDLNYEHLIAYWNGPDEDWGRAIATREKLEEAVMEQCDRLIAFVDGLDDDKLAASFTYKDSAGSMYERVYGPILDHVVNHATHHRGQVSAVISRCGKGYPAMDLLYYLREESSSSS